MAALSQFTRPVASSSQSGSSQGGGAGNLPYSPQKRNPNGPESESKPESKDDKLKDKQQEEPKKALPSNVIPLQTQKSGKPQALVELINFLEVQKQRITRAFASKGYSDTNTKTKKSAPHTKGGMIDTKVS